MFKIFDHGSYLRRWEEVEDPYKAIKDRFDTMYWQDKDNSYSHFIEVWNSETNEIVVQACDMGAWLGCQDEDGPYMSHYYGTIDELAGWSFKPTELKPNKDYIIV